MGPKRQSTSGTVPLSSSPTASMVSSDSHSVPPLEGGLAPSASFIVRTADKHMSFADLIRAREAQQQKLRGELEAQNHALRERLGLIANTLGGSPSGAFISDGGAADGSDWLSPPAVLREMGDGGDGTPTLGPARSASFSNVATSQQLMDVINFVADMKESVRRGQEADAELLHALQQRVEDQERRYEDRISVLEARLAGEERARDILREEQQDQMETLTTAVEELRESVGQQIQSRCSVLEGGLGNHQLSIETLNLSVESSDERVTALESSLAVLQRTQTRDEMRLHTLTESVERDRSLLSALNDETIYQRKEQLDQILKSAETQLEFAEKQMGRLQAATHAAQEDVERLVGSRMTQVEDTLREHMLDFMGKSRDTLYEQVDEANKQMLKLGEQVASEARSTRIKADEALSELHQFYRDSVDSTIAEVVARAKELENERRAEFPLADIDRVNLMIQELEGAAALLEGFAKTTVLSQHVGAGRGECPLTARLHSLESLVEELQTKSLLSTGGASKIMFSVDVQTGPLGRDNGPHWSDGDRVRQSVDRHLKSELELAAADHSAMRTRTETALTLLAAASSTASDPAQHAAATDRVGSLSPRSVTPGTWSRGASPRVGGTSQSTVQPPKSREGMLAFVISERQRKEATVEKIQYILREIQSKFHELSIREPLQRSLHTNMVDAGRDGGSTFISTPRSGTNTSEQIIKQKEAIFQKERQLVEQRNKLWREIGVLEEQEEQLLQHEQAFTG